MAIKYNLIIAKMRKKELKFLFSAYMILSNVSPGSSTRPDKVLPRSMLATLSRRKYPHFLHSELNRDCSNPQFGQDVLLGIMFVRI